MAQQIKKKFLSSEVVEYFDNQIDLVEQGLAQELIDRASGDSSTLTNANLYTDEKFSEEASLREAADLALDGRITTLEEQVGEDLQQAIIDLENSIAAEALARENADLALDGRLDSLESFGYDQVVYVSKNGVDTNTGKQHSPFLTITAAQNAITDASPTKRYVLKVAPGLYTETVALKANVFIVSEGQKESVRISGAVNLDSSFSGAGDHRSGFSNITLLLTSDFNWQTVTSAAGKLFFNEVAFNQSVTMYGHNNATAQAQFANCIFYGNLTVSGINVGVFADNVCFGNIQLNQHPNGGMATVLGASGGYCSGSVTLTTTVNDFNRRCGLFARSFYMNSITVNGSSSYADLTDSSIPSAGPTVLNGGNIVYLNRAGANRTLSNLEYPTLVNSPIMPANSGATNLGDWGKQWAWHFAYVHASSGTDLFLISYPASFAPDSSGKSIGIFTDGAGLQENVDGGSIEIATSTTSGTGVRGTIKLDGRHIDVSSKQVKNLADGTDASDAVNKGQLDTAISTIDLSDYATESYVDGAVSGVQGQLDTEKGRIDAILLASDADKDSFAEIVSLINSVDTDNDEAFAGYVLSNDARVDALEAKGFSKGSLVVGEELAYINLDREYETVLFVSVGRLAVHEGEDYTVSVVGGVTRLTWIGSLVSPEGAEAIETGDKVFWAGSY